MGEELRADPRFSMNKLAQYVVTQSPRRRRALIMQQIRPLPFITTRYEPARRLLVRHFSDPSRPPKQLSRMAAGLRDRAAPLPDDDDSGSSLIASARAVEAFAKIADRVKVNNVIAVAGPRRQADMTFSGVRVVVCPDVSFLERGTERRVGALKFHFSVTNRLDIEALRYGAAILHAFLENQGERPKRAACVAVDVMAAQHELAPRAMKDRIKNLEAACQEIAERWPVLYEALKSRAEASE